MKKLIIMFVLMTTSFAANSLDIRGDANLFSGKITSVTLTDEGGVINTWRAAYC